VDGIEDLFVIAAGKIRASDTASEEGISGKNHFERGEVEADGALCMARGVNHLGRVVLEADAAAVGEGFVGRGGFGRFYSEPSGLGGHHGEERQVRLVEVDGGAGERFEFKCSADMVDVGVGDENLLKGETEAGKPAVDSGDLVSWIDNDGLARFLVGEDGAVALEWTNRKGLEDHEAILGLESRP